MTQAFAEAQKSLDKSAIAVTVQTSQIQHSIVSAEGVSGSGLIQLTEPAALILLGSGLISFATGIRRKLK